MKGFNKLKNSRRFWVSLFGFVALVSSEAGLPISPEFLDALLDMILALVVGYSAQDVVVAYAKSKVVK